MQSAAARGRTSFFFTLFQEGWGEKREKEATRNPETTTNGEIKKSQSYTVTKRKGQCQKNNTKERFMDEVHQAHSAEAEEKSGQSPRLKAFESERKPGRRGAKSCAAAGFCRFVWTQNTLWIHSGCTREHWTGLWTGCWTGFWVLLTIIYFMRCACGSFLPGTCKLCSSGCRQHQGCRHEMAHA